MPRFTITMKMLAVTLATSLLPLATPATAKSKSSIQHTEDNLAAAGFIVRPANTPARIAMLKRLPANKFVQRTHGETVNYVYADPKACACLYVGSQAAYGQYQKAMQAKNLLDQQQLNALDYQDRYWNWGAWGPWGGVGSRWGFGRRGW